MMPYTRLTYKAVGDAQRRPHYCAAPGVKKNDLVQRLGVFEDGVAGCDSCRHYHDGDGGEECDGCCRNCDEDRYERK